MKSCNFDNFHTFSFYGRKNHAYYFGYRQENHYCALKLCCQTGRIQQNGYGDRK